MKTENKSHTPPAMRDLWRTPRELFVVLKNEFRFDCDVAASDDNALCEHWITEEMDAFAADWGLVNWCNPPYSDIRPWVQECIRWAGLGRTVVLLVPADTSTEWFRQAFFSANETRLISGRLSFVFDGKPMPGNNKGSVLFIWRGCDRNRSVTLVDRDELMGIA
jgi:phage N-6-adenine-methyltransferase